ncbi:hypothetical protein NEIG_00080 [Nematocida sp. ERTm5]|nr:hypothetical protein NEIG_00080 [Nematocida sp. ERTm5]
MKRINSIIYFFVYFIYSSRQSTEDLTKKEDSAQLVKSLEGASGLDSKIKDPKEDAVSKSKIEESIKKEINTKSSTIPDSSEINKTHKGLKSPLEKEKDINKDTSPFSPSSDLFGEKKKSYKSNTDHSGLHKENKISSSCCKPKDEDKCSCKENKLDGALGAKINKKPVSKEDMPDNFSKLNSDKKCSCKKNKSDDLFKPKKYNKCSCKEKTSKDLLKPKEDNKCSCKENKLDDLPKQKTKSACSCKGKLDDSFKPKNESRNLHSHPPSTKDKCSCKKNKSDRPHRPKSDKKCSCKEDESGNLHSSKTKENLPYKENKLDDLNKPKNTKKCSCKEDKLDVPLPPVNNDKCSCKKNKSDHSLKPNSNKKEKEIHINSDPMENDLKNNEDLTIKSDKSISYKSTSETLDLSEIDHKMSNLLPQTKEKTKKSSTPPKPQNAPPEPESETLEPPSAPPIAPKSESASAPATLQNESEPASAPAALQNESMPEPASEQPATLALLKSAPAPEQASQSEPEQTDLPEASQNAPEPEQAEPPQPPNNEPGPEEPNDTMNTDNSNQPKEVHHIHQIVNETNQTPPKVGFFTRIFRGISNAFSRGFLWIKSFFVKIPPDDVEVIDVNVAQVEVHNVKPNQKDIPKPPPTAPETKTPLLVGAISNPQEEKPTPPNLTIPQKSLPTPVPANKKAVKPPTPQDNSAQKINSNKPPLLPPSNQPARIESSSKSTKYSKKEEQYESKESKNIQVK